MMTDGSGLSAGGGRGDDQKAEGGQGESLPPRRGGAPGDFTRITNVVFMGMGEPLSNLAAVVPAIRAICGLWGHAISARKVTISTVGLPKAIERLSEQLDLPVTLALSLHAPTDEIRRKLIPWAEYTTIADLLAACQKWFEKTGREITLEYTLLHGVNDQPEHAKELARIAKTLRANINLIRYNEVAGLPFERPRDENVRAFQEFLKGKNLNVHIRASRGRDIAAACGQLRHETGGKQRKREAAKA
jgi:23S rRNA (adenine2503-C2)-methyltransferase